MEFLQSIASDTFRAAISVETAIYALAAIGLNLQYGYAGLLNFGQVGFMLAGAYGFAIGATSLALGIPLSILLGLAASVVLALVLGYPSIRLRAVYLAIVTIATAEILRLALRSRSLEDLSGGVYGLQGFGRAFFDINPIRYQFDLGLITVDPRRAWLMLVSWSLVLLATVAVALLISTPWGRTLRSIKSDEYAAAAAGVNVRNYKLQSLVIGGFLGGAAGVLWALSRQSVHPDQFDVIVTVYAFAALFIGGVATIYGPVLGSVLFWGLMALADAIVRYPSVSDRITTVLPAESVGVIRIILAGLVLALLAMFRPQGIFGRRAASG